LEWARAAGKHETVKEMEDIMTLNNHEGPAVTIKLQSREHTGAFVTVGLALAFLLVANLYLLSRLTTARQDTADLERKMGSQIEELKAQNLQMLLKYSILKSSHADQLEKLREELYTAEKQLGLSTGQTLDRTRNMIVTFRRQQDIRSEDLEKQLASKAETDEVTDLNESLSSAQFKLESTGKAVNVLAEDLATARTELGGLLATTREQIQSLREQGESNYQEITLIKGNVYRVGYVNLILKKTDARKQKFSLNLITNDQDVQIKGRNVVEPIYFYVGQLRDPYELVITGVSSDRAVGYLRTPKTDAPQLSFVPRT
jgi:hypothetical protein